MTTTVKILTISCLLVGLVGGYFVGTMSGNKSVADLKARISSSSMTIPQMAETRQLSGTVTAVSGSTVTFKVQTINPLDDPSLDTRNVTINSSTKVMVSTPKDSAVFQKEMEAFQTAMKNVKPYTPGKTSTSTLAPASMPTPPQYFDQKDGSVSSFKVGQMINVTALANIKDQKSFTALTVNIQSIPGTPATPPPPAPTQ